MQINKLASYLGFAVKSGKIVMGVNALDYTRERVELLVLCHSAAKNTTKEAEKLAFNKKCPMVVLAGDLLENLVNKQNCKLAGITDKNLAKAVIALADGGYLKFFGGDSV